MLEKYILLTSLIGCIISPNVVFGEYRVFQYYVKSKFKLPYDSEAYLVTSTLDPVSYIAYNGGKDSIKVDLLKTWYCPGDTSKQEICKPSKELNKK